MSLGGAAGGAGTRAARLHARPLSGVQLWLGNTGQAEPGAAKHQSSAQPSPSRPEAAAGPEQVPCSGSKTNAKQRRAARRAGEQLLKRQAAAHAACQLRVVLLQALRKMRWERMQAVWTQWMRSRQAEARRREVLLCHRNRLWQARVLDLGHARGPRLALGASERPRSATSTSVLARREHGFASGRPSRCQRPCPRPHTLSSRRARLRSAGETRTGPAQRPPLGSWWSHRWHSRPSVGSAGSGTRRALLIGQPSWRD